MLQYIKKLIAFDNPGVKEWAIYFAVFAVLHIPGIINFYNNDGLNNAYLRFAESLSNGELTMPEMPAYDDLILFNDAYYLPYPPFPSVILLPFVYVFGYTSINTVVFAMVLTCINVLFFYKLLIKLNIDKSYIPWLIVGFFFGTGYWFALFTSHHVYSFAHIVSCTCQFLILYELFAKKRWWLVGLLIGFSFLTRQFTFLYILFALGVIINEYKNGRLKNWFKPALYVAAFTGIGVITYLVYNQVRFGSPFETGYQYILFNGVLKERVEQFGVFSYKYVLFNLYSFFIKGFNIEFTGVGNMQIKNIDTWGTSLLMASPFVISSFRSNLSKGIKVFAWSTIVIILTATLFYHNNGFRQVNTMRFSLDFLPLLFVLIATGVSFFPKWLFKSMVAYAVFLNVLSFAVHYFHQ